MTKQQELEKRCLDADTAYRAGTPIMSDSTFDNLWDELKRDYPDSELLKKSVLKPAPVVTTDRMMPLPYPMYSLEKVKTVSELFHIVANVWKLAPEDIVVITPKYDGISLLVEETSDGDVWTRGDGVEGQLSTEHFKSMQHGKGPNSRLSHLRYTFGEAIFPTSMFLKYVKDKGYKSARNCIAGLFNSPEVNKELLSVACYVRYGTSTMTESKISQLEDLNKHFNNVTTYWKTSAQTFYQDDKAVLAFLNNLFETLNTFKCDGLVVEVNSAEKRLELGRMPNNNPRYAVAFKNPDWSERYTTTVTDVEWTVSKDGKSKPVVKFDPIEFDGATVSQCTGNNAAYVVDNHLCPGAVIVVARSGDVIPRHIQTVKYDGKAFMDMMDDMIDCPSCGKNLKWDTNRIELICTNPMCKSKVLKKLVYFFNTLELDNFQESTIQKFCEAGHTTIRSIMGLSLIEMEQIPGIGKVTAKHLDKQFKTILKEGVPFAKLLTAYNTFNGVIGEKTCQIILDNVSEEVFKNIQLGHPFEWNTELTKVDGVSVITAKAFYEGVMEFWNCTNNFIPVSMHANEKVKAAENQMSVCFTGFRNEDWEKKLIEAGHLIASGVSKKTTHLVVADKDSTSSKMEKARKLLIPIYNKDEFKELMGWQ